jgi:hypothetical protein
MERDMVIDIMSDDMDIKFELTKLRQFNNSMVHRLRECSHPATSWIQSMVQLNKQAIQDLTDILLRE